MTAELAFCKAVRRITFDICLTFEDDAGEGCCCSGVGVGGDAGGCIDAGFSIDKLSRWLIGEREESERD